MIAFVIKPNPIMSRTYCKCDVKNYLNFNSTLDFIIIEDGYALMDNVVQMLATYLQFGRLVYKKYIHLLKLNAC